MTEVTTKVLRFLFEFIFSKVSLKEYFRVNKYFFILLIANIIISLLYVYMVEQAIIRTEQYRSIKNQLIVANDKLSACKKTNDALAEQLNTLQQNILTSNVTISTESIASDYSKWSAEIDSVQADIKSITPNSGKTGVVK